MWILCDSREKEVKDMCNAYLKIQKIAHAPDIPKNTKMDMIYSEIMRN